ncbi:hypothetical protein V2J09_000152 [Rumex salicifolius]
MFSTHHSSSGLNSKVEEDEERISQKAIEIARGISCTSIIQCTLWLPRWYPRFRAQLQTSSTLLGGAYISASEVAAKIPGCVNPNATTFVDCMLSLLASFSVFKFKIM